MMLLAGLVLLLLLVFTKFIKIGKFWLRQVWCTEKSEILNYVLMLLMVLFSDLFGKIMLLYKGKVLYYKL